MKKLITVGVLAFVMFVGGFNSSVKAFTTETATTDFAADTTITINLLAAPEGTENAVSISLNAVGMTILSYTPPTGTWLANTKDCANGQSYTAERVCTSLAKAETIEEGESLGTITLSIKGSTYAKLVKDTENAYSDGSSIRVDSGTFLEFNKAFENSGTTTTIDPTTIVSNLQPIILIVALVIIIILVVLMLWSRMHRKATQTETQVTSSF